MPWPIGDREQAHWRIPLDKERKWIDDLFLKDFVKTWLDVKSMAFQIRITNGGAHNFRPKKALRKIIHIKRRLRGA